jgi:hypothetical protein
MDCMISFFRLDHKSREVDREGELGGQLGVVLTLDYHGSIHDRRVVPGLHDALEGGDGGADQQGS